MKKQFSSNHYWQGQVKKIYELKDFLDPEIEIEIKAKIVTSSQELLCCEVTSVSFFIQTQIGRYPVVRQADIKDSLNPDLLKQLAEFMVEDYYERLNDPKDALSLSKINREAFLTR